MKALGKTVLVLVLFAAPIRAEVELVPVPVVEADITVSACNRDGGQPARFVLTPENPIASASWWVCGSA